MLQEEVISVSFAQGVQTKQDPKQIAAGALLTLQNGVFTKPGEIIKRNGYSSFGNTLFDQASLITSGNSLGLLNDTLTLTDNLGIYSYLRENDQWTSSGVKVNLELSTSNITGISGSTVYPAAAGVLNNLTLAISIDLTRSDILNGYFLDGQTNTPIQTFPLVPVTGISINNVQAVIFDNLFVFSHRQINGGASNISITSLDPVLGASPGLRITIGTDDPTGFCYQIAASANLLFVLYPDVTNGLTLNSYDTSFALVDTVIVTAANRLGFNMVYDAINHEVVVAYVPQTGNVTAVRYSSTLTLLSTPYTGGQGSGNVTLGINGTELGVFYEVISADTINYFMAGGITTSYRTSPTVYIQPSFAYNTRLYSTVFVDNNGYYFAVIHPKGIQPVQFILRYTLVIGQYTYSAGPSVVGKFALNTALFNGSATTLQGLVAWFGSYNLPYLNAVSTSLFGGAISGNFVVSLLMATFTEKLTNVTLGQNINYVGGIPSIYDGFGVASAGYNLFPEITSGIAQQVGTGFSYGFTVVYTWTDFQGNLHRSAPAVPIIVTSTAALSGANLATITVPGLGVDELYKLNNVVVQLYRTQNNGTIYYLIAESPNNQVGNVIISNGADDGGLPTSQQLYTTGGEIENIGPPPTNLMTSFKNRIILVDAENPLQWWFSKQVIQSFPAEFSDVLVQNIDQKGGNITALNTMDDKLIFFKQSNIWYVIGDGPSANGQNNDFTYPQIISSDTGCVNQSSIVLSPAGLFFQSPKGIYLLGRDLSLNYVGSPVEAYNSANVTSAIMIAGTTQIRFSLDIGIALVYDYFVQQWSIFTNVAAVDSIVYNHNYTYLTSSGIANTETPELFSDPSSTPIALSLTTGWISFAGLQNFQRVKQFLILGESENNTTMNVSLAYDFNSTITQTDAIPVVGSQIPMQYRIFTQLQKSETIQVSITEVPSTTGEGLRLSALAFNVARKKGPFKMPAAATFG